MPHRSSRRLISKVGVVVCLSLTQLTMISDEALQQETVCLNPEAPAKYHQVLRHLFSLAVH